MKKTTLVATALASALVASTAFAGWHSMTGKGCDGLDFEHGMSRSKMMKSQMDRTLTAEQVHTLQEARLIYKNNSNVKVGEVKKTDTGFSVSIVTKDNSLVEEKTLAPNGMDQERYNRMQKHMKQDKKHADKKGHHDGERGKRGHGRHGGHGKFGGKHMQASLDRQLTVDEVRTLQKARLIHINNPNLKVGEVKQTATGFSATIVTQDNSLVKELTLAKNGMMQDRYDMIKERMERKSHKAK